MQQTLFFDGEIVLLSDLANVESTKVAELARRIVDQSTSTGVMAQTTENFLRVSPNGAFSVTISPGTAYDSNGEFIHVAATQNLSYSSLDAGKSVVISHVNVDGSARSHPVTGALNNTRRTDSFLISLKLTPLVTDVILGVIASIDGGGIATITEATRQYWSARLGPGAVTNVNLNVVNVPGLLDHQLFDHSDGFENPFTSAQIVGVGITYPVTLLGTDTLTLTIDGGGLQTIPFTLSTNTPIQVVAQINATLIGAKAVVVAGQVGICSNTTGINSIVNITGGTAATKLGLPVASLTGIGGGEIFINSATSPNSLTIAPLATSETVLINSLRARGSDVGTQFSPLTLTFGVLDGANPSIIDVVCDSSLAVTKAASVIWVNAQTITGVQAIDISTEHTQGNRTLSFVFAAKTLQWGTGTVVNLDPPSGSFNGNHKYRLYSEDPQDYLDVYVIYASLPGVDRADILNVLSQSGIPGRLLLARVFWTGSGSGFLGYGTWGAAGLPLDKRVVGTLDEAKISDRFRTVRQIEKLETVGDGVAFGLQVAKNGVGVTLNYIIAEGAAYIRGSRVTVPGVSGAFAASSTLYVSLNETGIVVVSTDDFRNVHRISQVLSTPTTPFFAQVMLAVVTTSGTDITSIVDLRPVFSSTGGRRNNWRSAQEIDWREWGGSPFGQPALNVQANSGNGTLNDDIAVINTDTANFASGKVSLRVKSITTPIVEITGATSSVLRMADTGATSGQRNFDATVDGGVWTFRGLDDGYGSPAPFMTFTASTRTPAWFNSVGTSRLDTDPANAAWPRLIVENTFGGASAILEASGALFGALRLTDNGAAPNQKHYMLKSEDGSVSLFHQTDGYGNDNTVLNYSVSTDVWSGSNGFIRCEADPQSAGWRRFIIENTAGGQSAILQASGAQFGGLRLTDNGAALNQKHYMLKSEDGSISLFHQTDVYGNDNTVLNYSVSTDVWSGSNGFIRCEVDPQAAGFRRFILENNAGAQAAVLQASGAGFGALRLTDNGAGANLKHYMLKSEDGSITLFHQTDVYGNDNTVLNYSVSTDIWSGSNGFIRCEADPASPSWRRFIIENDLGGQSAILEASGAAFGGLRLSDNGAAIGSKHYILQSEDGSIGLFHQSDAYVNDQTVFSYSFSTDVVSMNNPTRVDTKAVRCLADPSANPTTGDAATERNRRNSIVALGRFTGFAGATGSFTSSYGFTNTAGSISHPGTGSFSMTFSFGNMQDTNFWAFVSGGGNNILLTVANSLNGVTVQAIDILTDSPTNSFTADIVVIGSPA